MSDLVERLRARKKVAPVYSGSVVRSSGPLTPPISVSQARPYPTALVNPDGEEAAAEIERLRAELAARDGQIVAPTRNTLTRSTLRYTAVCLNTGEWIPETATAIEAGSYREGEGHG